MVHRFTAEEFSLLASGDRCWRKEMMVGISP